MHNNYFSLNNYAIIIEDQYSVAVINLDFGAHPAGYFAYQYYHPAQLITGECNNRQKLPKVFSG